MNLKLSAFTSGLLCFSSAATCSAIGLESQFNVFNQRSRVRITRQVSCKSPSLMKVATLLACSTFATFSAEINTATSSNNEPRFMNFVSSGFPEFSPGAQIAFEQMKNTINSAYIKYGYAPLETPAIERVETIAAKGIGNKEIYALRRLQAEEGEGEVELALRFDLTVPLCRYVGENKYTLVFPFRRQAVGKVWRGEHASTGRFREFYQYDADIIGRDTLDIMHDAEAPAMINEIFQVLNVGEFVIRLNNRKVLQGLFESFGLNESQSIKQAIRIVDAIEKVSREETILKLSELGINGENASTLIDLLTSHNPNEVILAQLKDMASRAGYGQEFSNGVADLESVYRGMLDLGVPAKRTQIDLSIARGLDYYTGTVYETNLIGSEDLGSVCSGGRYDELVSKLMVKKDSKGGEEVSEVREQFPGVGISIGLTRLFTNLVSRGLINIEKSSPAKVLMTVQDRSFLSTYQNLAKILRAHDIPTEIYYQTDKLKKQLKFASSKGIDYAVIGNAEEMNSGNINVKNLNTHTQTTVKIEDILTYFR